MTLPRLPLATLPTPLEQADGLAAAVGVDQLFLKRDDLTGFGLGGNKVRKLELLAADAQRRGADTLLVQGGPKSNLCQAAATVARVAGLRCELILYGHRPEFPPVNLRLAEEDGAIAQFTGDQARESVDVLTKQRTRSLEREGHAAYVVPRGGATAVGAAGYHLAALELHQQLQALDIHQPVAVVVSVGSGGTIAGLVSGAAAVDVGWTIIGASVSRQPAEVDARVGALSRECASLLGTRTPGTQPLIVDARGEGFGHPSPAGDRAAETVRTARGVMLDPTYTAKAFAVLVQRAQDGVAGPFVFWHTGGIAAVIDNLFRRELP